MNWIVGNYVNKDGKKIAWMMPEGSDVSDTKTRYKGISPGNALKILDSLPRLPEVIATTAVAKKCHELVSGTPSSSSAPPPLPGTEVVKYHVAYADRGALQNHPQECTADEVVALAAGKKRVLVCKVGDKNWSTPEKAGIVLPAVSEVSVAAESVVTSSPPPIPETEEVAAQAPPPLSVIGESGEDLMRRVIASRMAS